jgi:polyvinyl alcohol dehydrogenase (cytochrome)
MSAGLMSVVLAAGSLVATGGDAGAATSVRLSQTTGCGPTSGRGQAPWPEFDGNGARSGVGVSVAAPAGQVHQQWKTPVLDGAAYAQPLVAGGCLFVATEDNSVYAFNTSSGQLVWHTHLAVPVTSGLPCGDIDPSGITGTPALDPATGMLWVVVLTNSGGGPSHQVVELKASTGQVERRQDIAMPGRLAAAEQERGALAVADGNVYIPLGGLFGDCSNYVGGVVSVPEKAGHAPGYWAVPTARGAGMWEPSGPDVLANGDLLIADGNGAASPGEPFDDSDAVIELSPSLRAVGDFAPSDWAQLNETDGDLDSTGPAVLPGSMSLIVGKAGTGYLLDTGHLGGVGGQVGSTQVCEGTGAFGADAVAGETVYVPCTDGLAAVAVSGRALHVLWHSSGGGEGSPVVAGGKVWEETPQGALFGINAATGAVSEELSFPSPVTHFPWLVAVGSNLYAPDGSSVVALARI